MRNTVHDLEGMYAASWSSKITWEQKDRNKEVWFVFADVGPLELEIQLPVKPTASHICQLFLACPHGRSIIIEFESDINTGKHLLELAARDWLERGLQTILAKTVISSG